MPSTAQEWLWEKWCEYWSQIDDLRTKHGAKLVYVNNGDLTEGFHHHSTQIHSVNPIDQHKMAAAVLSVPLSLNPDEVWIIRGTVAHVGPNASFEEALAREIGAEHDEETGTYSHWVKALKAHGKIIEFAHHARNWGRPWTKHTAVGTLAAEITYDYANDPGRRPAVVFRSDQHRWNDSGDIHPVRVVITGCFQLATSFIHKIAPGKLPHIGGASALVHPDGEIEVKKHKFPFERDEPVEVVA